MTSESPELKTISLRGVKAFAAADGQVMANLYELGGGHQLSGDGSRGVVAALLAAQPDFDHAIDTERSGLPGVHQVIPLTMRG